jgi:hypothetical protein
MFHLVHMLYTYVQIETLLVYSLCGPYCWSLSVSDRATSRSVAEMWYLYRVVWEVATADVMLRDETWFYLSGYVNSHNSRHWSAENPAVICECHKISVWHVMNVLWIVGSSFFFWDFKFTPICFTHSETIFWTLQTGMCINYSIFGDSINGIEIWALVFTRPEPVAFLHVHVRQFCVQ